MQKHLKTISRVLLLVFTFEILQPLQSLALTGGPSQPEVQSFEPVGTTQLVDLFSGDFNYNIPLMDVDGYPLNIAYHSGITMDQEASWVGLGWNLNPGVVNRNLRGIPDDFNGDLIEKELRHKPNLTTDVSVGADFEFLGVKLNKFKKIDPQKKYLKFELGYNLGISYNNYRGIGFSTGIDFSSSLSKTPVNSNKYAKLGLNLQNNSSGDLMISPQLNYPSNNQIGISTNISNKEGLLNTTLSNNYFIQNSGISYSGPGSRSFIPSISMPIRNLTYSFNFKKGPSIFGADPSFNISGTQSIQYLADDKINRKAYGSLYLQNESSDNDNDLLDYSREKDNQFSEKSPVIAIPQLTQDIFNFSGQGIGGAFKAFRSDIPIIHDAATTNKADIQAKRGYELGKGSKFKIGANIGLSLNWSESHAWRIWDDKDNPRILSDIGLGALKNNPNTDPLFEPSYFKVLGDNGSADEKFNPFESLNESFDLKVPRVSSSEQIVNASTNFKRKKRDIRGQLVSALTADQSNFCLSHGIPKTVNQGSSNYLETIPRIGGYRNASHNSEISITKEDGSRFVYGIPAYNITQVEYQFTNAKEPYSNDEPQRFCDQGEVEYSPNFSKFQGIDAHKEVIKTPAYAHSYLLTAVLSPDYQDVDGNGPTENDLGSYTKINYSLKNSNYKWRIPFRKDKASLNEGLKSDKYDNSASFVYGEKEIWHVHSIEGLNHVAYFYTSERRDGFGVGELDGGLSAQNPSYKLDSIVLYSKTDLDNPIKTVVFEYSYKLCPNTHNNIDYATNTPNSLGNGKLTLTKLYFRYGNSFKGKFNAYKFDYDFSPEYNASYHIKGYDAWGNYKPASVSLNEWASSAGACDDNNKLLATEFPFSIQNKSYADQYATQWHLKKITLPSGGSIEVDYESDDYAYVQDRGAMQMYFLKGFAKEKEDNPTPILFDSYTGLSNNICFVEIPANIDYKGLRPESNSMLFNVLMDIDGKGNYEYVRGYATIEDLGVKQADNEKQLIWIRLKGLKLTGYSKRKVNPISSTGFSFARLFMPHLVNPGSNTIKSNQNNIKTFAKTLTGFIPNLYNMLKGRDRVLFDKGFCKLSIPGKSWVRLNNVSGFKYGGGSRVKRIISSDVWDMMDNNSSTSLTSNSYTQNFFYTKAIGKNEDGSIRYESSGVASWEPAAAMDENPFKNKGREYTEEHVFVPDESFNVEEPFGESYYPGATVGYSRVSVVFGNAKNISNTDYLKRNGTGKTVSEFYTAKDFPVIKKDPEVRTDYYKPSLLLSMFGVRSNEFLTMTQKMLIELNDMHGKPKAVWNYSQNHVESNDASEAQSGTTYEYFETVENGKRRLDNKVTVLNANGKISKALLATEAEVVIDTRQSISNAIDGTASANFNVSGAGAILWASFTLFPSYSKTNNKFQSAASVKLVQKYGILKKVTAFEEGATLTTENTVFDAITGEVLINKTQNEFEDNIYQTNLPAYWAYEGMGPAYKNQKARFNLKNSTTHGFVIEFNNVQYAPDAFLYHGDLLKADDSDMKLWVYKHQDGKWRIINENGVFVNIPTQTVTVIQSGRKNMQSVPLASFTQLTNPVLSTGFVNLENDVIATNVAEFDSIGKIQNCFNPPPPITKCLTFEAGTLLDYFVTRYASNFFKIDSLSQYGISGVDITIINESTSNTFGNSEYKKLWDRYYPGLPYKVKFYVEKIAGYDWSDSHYRFGYKFDDIVVSEACKQIRFKMEASAVTSTPTTSSNYSTSNNSCNYSGFPTNCYFPFNNTINSYLPIDGLIWHSKYLNYSGCDCYPTQNSCGNNCETIKSDSGFCHTGSSSLFTTIRNIRQLVPASTLMPNLTSKNSLRLLRLATSPYSGSVNSNGNAGINVRNIEYYAFSQYLETDLCKPVIAQKTLNPFVHGLSNNWKPKKSWAFVQKRGPENAQSNIRKDGTIVGFNSFWLPNNNTGRLQKTSQLNNWQYSKETTKYSRNGAELESRNPLGIYSATLLNENGIMPVAVANNAAYHQILALNFEKDNSITASSELQVACPSVHQTHGLVLNLLDINYSHTGNYSYKIQDSSRLFVSYLNNQNLAEMQTWNSSSFNEYKTKSSDYVGVFEPNAGKYYISAWVRTNNDNMDYSGSKIVLVLSDDKALVEASNITANQIVTFTPSGPVIDGWQKIEGYFTVGSTKKAMMVKFVAAPGSPSWFDDFRIQPFNSEMKSYVFDSKSKKMIADLDGNNFATFYEYDKEGNLIRIKKETERGIVTVKEVRNSFKKIQ